MSPFPQTPLFEAIITVTGSFVTGLVIWGYLETKVRGTMPPRDYRMVLRLVARALTGLAMLGSMVFAQRWLFPKETSLYAFLKAFTFVMMAVGAGGFLYYGNKAMSRILR